MPQGAAATSPQASPAAIYARADPAMDTEIRDPGTYHSPSSGPTEPRSPGPTKQPGGTPMRTNKSTHTHIPNVKTNNSGCHTVTHTPHIYSVLPGTGANTLESQPAPSAASGGGPLPAGMETGRPPQQQSRLVRAPPEPEQPRPRPRSPARPQPPTTPIQRGAMYRRGVYLIQTVPG
ncbi:hypothetical protein CHARACLAT_019241 [Characodon lateralis]|uniref:Uncharacterized protein n=1 Tax=Characodon lateralis TaxID=208331 RepID=A0ABU7CYZ4_9TELE|nr:hypothetical protein [Characodon lateralis]